MAATWPRSLLTRPRIFCSDLGKGGGGRAVRANARAGLQARAADGGRDTRALGGGKNLPRLRGPAIWTARTQIARGIDLTRGRHGEIREGRNARRRGGYAGSFLRRALSAGWLLHGSRELRIGISWFRGLPVFDGTGGKTVRVGGGGRGAMISGVSACSTRTAADLEGDMGESGLESGADRDRRFHRPLPLAQARLCGSRTTSRRRWGGPWATSTMSCDDARAGIWGGGRRRARWLSGAAVFVRRCAR